jgi:hypothetical protein
VVLFRKHNFDGETKELMPGHFEDFNKLNWNDKVMSVKLVDQQ